MYNRKRYFHDSKCEIHLKTEVNIIDDEQVNGIIEISSDQALFMRSLPTNEKMNTCLLNFTSSDKLNKF